MKLKEFKLSKYPVVTDKAEYKVDVQYYYGSYNIKTLDAIIYIERKNKKWYQSKFKRVYDIGISSMHPDFNKWIGKYIDFAVYRVKEYEDKEENKKITTQKHEKGIEDFINWDGKIK